MWTTTFEQKTFPAHPPAAANPQTRNVQVLSQWASI